MRAICVILILLPYGVCLGTYYYLEHSIYTGPFEKDTYSLPVSTVSSSVTPNPDRTEAIYTSRGYTITEERGVLITLIFSIILLLLAILLNYVGSKKYGKSEMDLPIVFSAFMGIVLLIMTIKNTGIYTYA